MSNYSASNHRQQDIIPVPGRICSGQPCSSGIHVRIADTKLSPADVAWRPHKHLKRLCRPLVCHQPRVSRALSRWRSRCSRHIRLDLSFLHESTLDEATLHKCMPSDPHRPVVRGASRVLIRHCRMHFSHALALPRPNAPRDCQPEKKQKKEKKERKTVGVAPTSTSGDVRNQCDGIS